MPIQWYPGHMVKARRVIAEAIPSQDVLIEVLDARMPAASGNPVLAELRGRKPCIKVLNKSDLADPDVTRAWLRHLESEGVEPDEAPPGGGGPQGAVVALALSTKRPSEAKSQLPELCRKLTRRKIGPGSGVRVMIVGIPNVGKSTLINVLTERRVAAVGDVPAVTKARQQVVLESGLILSDNPGILWPKLDDDATSLRLALCNAIPDTAIDYEMVGVFAAQFLLDRYPRLVLARYKLDAAPPSAEALLHEIGRRRGALRAGGKVNLHKASDVLVHDFRSGALGRISLETPPTSPAAPPENRDDEDLSPPSA